MFKGKPMKSFRKNVPKKVKQAIKSAKAVLKTEVRKVNRRRAAKPTIIGQALRRVGRLAGNYVGLGGVGQQVGAGISRIFGQGDYQIPLRNSLMMNGVPSFSPLTSGFRLRHREYIRDIQSSVAFSTLTFPLNPGQPETFPWLSTVAQNFEEYKIHGMIVYLNTTSATAIGSTNTALGIWGAVTQYDPSEADFTNKQQCENYVGCQTSVPSASLIHGIECMPRANVLDKYFVRSGVEPSAEDLKFYDIGKLQIFTQGSQAVATIGEMWVSYDVEFMKPRLPSGGDNLVHSDRFSNVTGASHTNPFGTGSTAVAGSNLGSVPLGFTVSLPSTAPNTKYVMVARWLSDAHTTGTFSVTYSGSLSGVNWFSSDAASFYQSPSPGTLAATRDLLVATFRKTSDVTGLISLAGWAFGTNASSDVIITQVTNLLAPQTLGDRLMPKEVKLLRKLLEQQREEEEKIDFEEPIHRRFEYVDETPNNSYESVLPGVTQKAPTLIRNPVSVRSRPFNPKSNE